MNILLYLIYIPVRVLGLLLVPVAWLVRYLRPVRVLTVHRYNVQPTGYMIDDGLHYRSLEAALAACTSYWVRYQIQLADADADGFRMAAARPVPICLTIKR